MHEEREREERDTKACRRREREERQRREPEERDTQACTRRETEERDRGERQRRETNRYARGAIAHVFVRGEQRHGSYKTEAE